MCFFHLLANLTRWQITRGLCEQIPPKPLPWLRMTAQVVGEGFTWWSWENVLTICCLLSLCIFRPPLSPDSHCSAKCSSIQGSFHVPVTLLGVPVQYRPAASSLTLKCSSSYCAAAGPFAYVAVHLESFFFLCLCVHGCIKSCMAVLRGASTS